MADKSVTAGYVSAVLSAALFGSVSPIAKPVLSTVNPLLLSCVVYLIAALTLTPLAHQKKMRLVKKEYLLILATSISGAVIAPILYFYGLQQTTASNTAVLANNEIVFTVLIAIIFFKEKLRPIGYIASVLVATGVTIVTTNLQFSVSLLELDLGNLLVIGSSIFWALDNNISKIVTDRVSSVKIGQLKSAIGGALLLALVLLLKIPLTIGPLQIPFVILLGVGGFAGSLYFFLRGLKRIGVIKTIMIFAMSSVFGLIFSSLFLHEQISLYQLVAIIVMMCGIYLINKQGATKTKPIPP